jgi:ABC-type transport system substrate-binding protein/class 3 adenylate cyclase
MGDRPADEPAGEPAGIRTFLIADVRGYTLFTQERGDEAAAKLAARFAGIAREAVEQHGGSVIELRGDEALAVFTSARQAILAATHAQDRFLEETIADPTLPLPVGIGLDAGEAVPVEGGYRGGALNLAARLCGQAVAGEILASQGVIHLARKVEGVRTQDRGELHLKNLTDPVHVFRLISEEADPAVRFREFAPAPPRRDATPVRLARAHPAIASVVALALIAAVAIPAGLVLLGGGTRTIVGDALAMIDLESGKLTGSVPLTSRPGAVAVGDGSVWVTLPDRGEVDQIDPASMTVGDRIAVGADPSGIAIGAGSVWVTNGGSSTVSRISPDTNSAATIDVPGGPTGIAVGRGGVWVTSSLEASVSRIDPESNEVRPPVGVGDRPSGVAIDDLGVWVANAASGDVSRINPDTNSVRPVPEVGHGPRAIVAGPDGVWVANSLGGTVAHIDPVTNEADQTISVGGAPTGLTLAGGFVWVSQGSSGSVTRIAPGSEPTSIQLGSEANDIALGDSVLWVTVRGDPSAHRGGTLTVWAPEEWFDSIDPALAYNPATWDILALTSDGLVGFSRAGGLEGISPVADLALSLPPPTDGGRTYTFQLRQGLTYSTGEPVRPQDFRRAIERVFSLESPGSDYYRTIVGADACQRKPGDPCHLHRGIVADDAANTVTFHLSAPNPDFFYALAMPFAYAVPAESPVTLPDDDTFPATGPYVIDRYEAGKRVVLGRNPEFEVSEAARPDGFPDRIVWRFGSDEDRMVADTLGDKADFMLFPLPDQIPKLEIQVPGQLHHSPRANTAYMSMNTQVPPFDDVDVRQALNFAVDREETATLSGDQWLNATCQIIPPTLPGYRPDCPYTRDPLQRTWTAPDFARAQSLVNRSGTAREKVTVWASEEAWPISVPIGRYFVTLLKKLHYRATLKKVDAHALFSALGGGAQITFAMWTTDYADASGFIPPVLECGAKYNYGGFCDPDIDRRMERAASLRSTDLARSLDLWSEVDHDLVKQARWVPLGNADWVSLVSQRLGNYRSNPVWGPLVDQMWVQ